MFGFGRRNWKRESYRNSGVFAPANLRRAAVAGLGILAYRWWRNRQAGRPGAPQSPAGNW